MSLPAFSARQVVLVNVVFLVVCLAGIQAARRIPIDIIPDISCDASLVTTLWRGASAQEVERLVTSQLEDEIEEISGIKEYFSGSGNGLSEIVIEWDESLSEIEYEAALNDLRAAINGSDLRIAYHVLAQYRRLAEQLLEDGRGEQTREIAEYMRYYGQLGDERGMSFLLETVAYDISLLVEHAAQLDGPALDGLLQIFLEVDRPEEPLPGEEDHLLGVRRVQVQLATFFLARDDEPRARLIYQDMAGDRRERLHVIYDELSREERPSYWEFTDRGVNFAYLPPERRAQLATFFSWFGGDLESRD